MPKCHVILPRLGALLCSAGILLTSGAVPTASGQANSRELRAPGQLEQHPCSLGNVCVNLTVQYTDPEQTRIFNPITGDLEKVRLRSYGGALVGPTIFVSPGDVLSVKEIAAGLGYDDVSRFVEAQSSGAPCRTRSMKCAKPCMPGSGEVTRRISYQLASGSRARVA